MLPVSTYRFRAARTTVVFALLLRCGFAYGAAPLHFADADDTRLVARGTVVYAQNCAGCHGRHLEGQALWQLQDRYAARRAPAHDASGHTWQHSDDDLFRMTKFGRFANTARQTPSYMPAFGKTLGDADIRAVLAFIKSRWPVGLRAAQATLNPGWAGMPKNLAGIKWSLPPNCSASLQNREQSAR